MRNVLCFASTTCLGFFAGAMGLIALSLLPYWHSLAPLDYRGSFRAMGPFLGQLMIPLLFLSIGLALVSALAAKPTERIFWWIAFLLVFGIVPLYVVLHAPINDSLLGNTELTLARVEALRHRWAFLHWTRTLLGWAAFGISWFGREIR